MLDQLSMLLEIYEDRGIKSREYYFMRDMEYNLKRDRNISEGQLAWLDKILKRGAPQPVDHDSLAKIESLLELGKASSSKNKVLLNLRSQVYSGKTLTAKQQNLIAEIESQLITFQPFIKDSATIKEMKCIIKLSKSRPNTYWRMRPQQHQAISEIGDWLEWNQAKKTIREPTLDKTSYKKMQGIFRRQLSVLRESPHPEGSMRAIKTGSVYHTAVVVGPPYISSEGNILHPVLVNGRVRGARTLYASSYVNNG